MKPTLSHTLIYTRVQVGQHRMIHLVLTCLSLDYVTSAASGHQRSDGRVTQEGLKERAEKLRGQYRPAAASGSSSGEEKPLRNVKGQDVQIL